MNKVYVSFPTVVKDVDLIKAVSDINTRLFSDSFLLGGVPDSQDYLITIRAKEPGYHWINFSYNLTSRGFMLEYNTSGDLFMIWLMEYIGHAVAELLNGSITYEDYLNESASPSYHLKYPTFSVLANEKNKSILDFRYVVPSTILI